MQYDSGYKGTRDVVGWTDKDVQRDIRDKLKYIVLWMQTRYSTNLTTTIKAGWADEEYVVNFSFSPLSEEELIMEILDVKGLKAKGAERIPVISVLDMKGHLHRMQPVTVVPKPPVGTGTQETMEAIEFIAGVANMIYNFVTQPGIGWFKIVWNVIPLVKKAIPAIKGLSLIPQELDDLTIQEKSEVLEAVAEHLEFSNDVEAIVNIALDIIYRVKMLAGVFK
jgi:hypothetical protein